MKARKYVEQAAAIKIGFIFECGPQGADKQVCEYLAKKIRTDITPVSRTLGNKRSLLEQAGLVAATLLKEGCERVLIIWDLRPAWPDKKQPPCRKAEKDKLLERMHDADIAAAPVFLICIEQELESWLLADETKISAHLSTDAHSYNANRVRKPDQVQNPKSVMMKHFKTARGWSYEDHIHAIKLMRLGEINLKKLQRSTSFARFETKLQVVLP